MRRGPRDWEFGPYLGDAGAKGNGLFFTNALPDGQAAFLNAAFGYCLGCEMFLLVRRVTARAE